MSTPWKVGPKAVAWLRPVGVRTQEDLVEVGAVAAYVKCKRAGFRPSLNMLYALEGALLAATGRRCRRSVAPSQAPAEAQIANTRAARPGGGADGVGSARCRRRWRGCACGSDDFTEGDDDSRERED